MDVYLLNHETAIRLGFFVGVFLCLGACEKWAPRRALTVSKRIRWLNNLSIVLIDSLAVRWLLPVVALGTAFVAQERGWGLLNNIDLPQWVAFCASVAALDLIIYLQHVMFHSLPMLWRVHRMHHADLDFDVTTALRFHPIEIILSVGIKMAAVVLIGPPPAAVLTFEVLLNATAMFNHSNLRIPVAVDRILRLFVVTPDMHRVHHSILTEETDSNFGFNLPWWDRLLGTYRNQPAAGHEDMTIGLDVFRDPKMLRLPQLLAMPFLKASM